MGYGRFRRPGLGRDQIEGRAILPWIGQQAFLEKLNHVFGALAR
jgi:hypothetical protein